MRLDWLEVFLTVADELHFGRTADRLGMSQPAVSRAVAALEASLGTQLLDRTSRQVALTPAGVAFERGARETTSALARATRAARAGVEGGLSSIRLGMMIGAAQPPVGRLVAELRLREPAALVTLVTVDERGLATALTSGEVDAVAAWQPSVPAGLYSRPLASVPLVVLLPEGHPLASRKVVRWADLADEEVLIPARERQPVVYDLYRTLASRAEVVPRIAMDVATTTDLLLMVASGAGIGHAPIPVELRWDGVVVRRHEPEIEARYVLAWAVRTAAVNALLQALDAVEPRL